MKDLMSRKEVISEEIESVLNEQIKIEGQSSADYLSMAVWCDVQGYSNSAKFFYNQAEEEREHKLKFLHYLSDMGSVPVVPVVKAPTNSFSTLKEVFEEMFEMEKSVTKSIHNIVSICRKENDYSTEEFMMWYVKEQREEEYVAREQLNLLELLGDDKLGLALFEDKVLTVSYEEE